MANDASLTYVVSADKDGAEPPRSPASRLLRSAAIIGSYSLRAQGVDEIGGECHATHPCRSRLAGEPVVSADKDGAEPMRSPASRLLRSAAIIGSYRLRAQGVDGIGGECHAPCPCRSRLAGEPVVSADKDGADPTRSPASRLLRSAAIIGSNSLRDQGVDESAAGAMRRITVGAGLLANLSCQPIEMAQSQCVREEAGS